MIIAVDGPAASGKGTLARRLAAHYGLAYLDTGVLYRAVAQAVLASGQATDDPEAALAAARALDLEHIDAGALRSRRLGDAASQVAAHPAVRQALIDHQRAIAATPPGAVLDGRDIGTHVCPDADVKLFVTASLDERARRRHEELTALGDTADLASVRADLEARDLRDRSRSVAPLRQAPDAHLLDTTNLDIEAAFKAAVALIDSCVGRLGCA